MTKIRTGTDAGSGPDRCRLQGAGVDQHPRRDLGQVVGQSDLQSGFSADARDTRGNLPVRTEPRNRQSDDGRGPEDRREGRRAIQDRTRETD